MKTKSTLLILFLFLFQHYVFSQAEPVFTIVESMPEYPGGPDEMHKFIAKNVKYPKSAIEKDKEGTVYVTFVIDTVGNITEARILRGVADAPELDAEALRVVNMMPTWKPGTQNGRKVKTAYNLPIKFKLNKTNDKGKKKKKK